MSSVQYSLHLLMGIHHSCIGHKHLAISVWEGSASLADWTESLQHLASNPAHIYVRNHVVDMRFASLKKTFDPRPIATVAPSVAAAFRDRPGYQIAIAAGKEFELSRLCVHAFEPYVTSIIVFNHLDTACTWLRLEHTEVEKEIHKIRFLMDAHPGGTAFPPHPII